MSAESPVLITASSLKNINRLRKRKINVNKWKHVERKALRDAGKQYVSKRGRTVAAKVPPMQVS